MTKKTDPSGLSKTIICHVEGFPKPAIQWTITGSGSVINQASICLLVTCCTLSNVFFFFFTNLRCRLVCYPIKFAVHAQRKLLLTS